MDYTASSGRDTIKGMDSPKISKTARRKPAAIHADKVAARKADRHRKKMLPARATEELRAVLDSIAAEERRSVAQIVEILIEEALKARGHWPPQPK